MNSTKEFTADKLKKFEASGADIPYAQDSDADTVADNWGMKAASTSNEGRFKSGGSVKPHMGRARRASGGKVMREPGSVAKIRSNDSEEHISYKKEIPKPTALRLGDYPKIRASGGKVDNSVDTGWTDAYSSKEGPTSDDDKTSGDYDYPSSMSMRAKGGKVSREHRASGGRTGKGKTVVNVIVGGGNKQQQPTPVPVPVPAPPQAAPPPPPPHPMVPPMGGAPGMPPGAGAPAAMPPQMPPGGMPMRASGGKVMGGAGGGLGRIQKANSEGAHIPVPKN